MTNRDRPLRVLVAEDEEDDFILIERALRTGGFGLTIRRVDTGEGLRRALDEESWDIVLSDYSMPHFTALDALAILRGSRHPQLPFVVVSGSIGEERAVAALKEGAANYVMKGSLRSQLAHVVERELEDARVRHERTEAIDALEKAVKARDDFLSIASHELKTPLTSLQLQVESLLAAAESGALLTPAKIEGKLGSIARSTARLTELIERLLDTTRVTGGPMKLVVEELDLADVLRDVLRRLETLFADAESPVTLEAAAGTVGRWDRERIATMLTNLLGNAAKYGAGKPVRVRLERRGTSAVIRVKDEGDGIPPEDQPRVFERFERAVSTRQDGGFGIGLWLARRIASAHGGAITLESTPGAGSTFIVELPVQ